MSCLILLFENVCHIYSHMKYFISKDFLEKDCMSEFNSEYQKRINLAQVYIQNHLDEDITLDDIAKEACFSPFHFHRIFSSYSRESLFGYIKRLRLERAASELMWKDDSIIEVAKRAHFKNSSSFAKAFKEYFGESPSIKKENLKNIIINRKNELEINANNDIDLGTPEIINIESLDMVSYKGYGACLETGYKTWDKFENELLKLGYNSTDYRRFGIARDNRFITEETFQRYEACLLMPNNLEISDKLFRQKFDGGEYAVFTHLGSYMELCRTAIGIMTIWLPNCEYTLRAVPFFEEYMNHPKDVEEKELITKLYVPIY